MDTLAFNPASSTILHIDLNSCFATVEQQANPFLRGKPIAVAAYASPNGCILAPSIEAKRYGVQTGMRVRDGKMLCPSLTVLPPDPWKYRNVHLALRKLIRGYTSDFYPKSIDEFVLHMAGFPALKKAGMEGMGKEIKMRIRKEIGDWLTVSVGIAPNRFLAKLAAGLRKPDGLVEISKENFKEIFGSLELTDLHGIKARNAARLNKMGIFTVRDFYQGNIRQLKAAFHSINGYYWYLRLRGWEIDDVEFGRRSYGNSYALPKPLATPRELAPLLSKLVSKMGARLRKAGYGARGIHVAVSYRTGGFWHKGVSFDKVLFDSRDMYDKAYRILSQSPFRYPVRNLAVSSFNLIKVCHPQLEFFDDVEKKRSLVAALDKVNERWGSFVVTPARMLGTERNIPDRIAFGGIKELEEFTLA